MAAGLTDIREIREINRIWYGCLCIEFNRDSGLSPAELRVISLLLKGYKSGQIAALCSRSVKTISAQKGQAFKRLGVSNDATLLSALLLHGVVTVYIVPDPQFTEKMKQEDK
ncbi:helix-turn-helix transcriptional regulator [Salmonella enterica]|nr:helix-turn-helix transcriptional regulator [Salmonella enterica subsp. salamae]EHI7819057.1 helix-turn-helix transcriptional regulator [Salmonella enterica]EHJ0754523.1 helix-turn-helix transcriptional regulator [Salmonella enterica]EKT7566628.1 helix-turn-helix transcriptional regulator [Salmonella enterica]EKT7774520.1 helix-turn-helix transcriptional regulator [Salmonella enterica]